jgi:hypothetical protein
MKSLSKISVDEMKLKKSRSFHSNFSSTIVYDIGVNLKFSWTRAN